MRPCVCLSACALAQCLCVDHCADAWMRLRACAGARVPRTGVPDGAASRSPRCALVSVCLPARSRSAGVWITVLMRGCGCVRARVRGCLGLASRTAQGVGHRDAPLCLSACARARAASVYCVCHSMQPGLSSCREVLSTRMEGP